MTSEIPQIYYTATVKGQWYSNLYKEYKRNVIVQLPDKSERSRNDEVEIMHVKARIKVHIKGVLDKRKKLNEDDIEEKEGKKRTHKCSVTKNFSNKWKLRDYENNIIRY